MIKTFLENLCKEIQKPKMQKTLKGDILAPLLAYICNTFAPYFITLCVLLLTIIILLGILLYRPRGFYQGF